MQTFTGQFWVDKKLFALGSQILFPACVISIYPKQFWYDTFLQVSQFYINWLKIFSKEFLQRSFRKFLSCKSDVVKTDVFQSDEKIKKCCLKLF